MADEQQDFLDAVKEYNEFVKDFASKYKEYSDAGLQEEQEKMQSDSEQVFKPLEKLFKNLSIIIRKAEQGGADAENCSALLKAHPEWVAMATAGKVFVDILPYVEAELKEYPDASDKSTELLLAAALRRARADGLDIPYLEADRVTVKKADDISYPVDKPSRKMWNCLETAEKHGQLSFRIDTPRPGDEAKDIYVLYSVNFDALDEIDCTITKQLTAYDKRVYIACAALYAAGNNPVSATQIYRMMGNTGRPSSADLNKINRSVTKMGATWIYLNNEAESKVYNGYKHSVIDSNLLPFIRKNDFINGKFCESTIYMTIEPPVITFAKERKQITTIKRKLLESPISKTEANLRIEDYLLDRIAHMKRPNSKTSNKILYERIFKECGISTRMQKSRAPGTIKEYLDYYYREDWIAGYTVEKDGIVIDPGIRE